MFPAAEYTTARWLPVRPVLLFAVTETPDTGDLRCMTTLTPQRRHSSNGLTRHERVGLVQVLRATGLKVDVDQEAFAAIARQIEADWHTASFGMGAEPGSEALAAQDAIWHTAMEAAKYFREHATRLHGADLYSQLSTIAFVPATKVPPCVPAAVCSGLQFCCPVVALAVWWRFDLTVHAGHPGQQPQQVRADRVQGCGGGEGLAPRLERGKHHPRDGTALAARLDRARPEEPSCDCDGLLPCSLRTVCQHEICLECSTGLVPGGWPGRVKAAWTRVLSKVPCCR